MKISQKIVLLSITALLVSLMSLSVGCGVYSFKDVSIPDSVKTIRVQFIENRAPYVNPQLSPNLTEGVRRKIVNQTRLTQTNADNAHYDVSGEIRDYSVSTSAISDQREVNNRLTVSVHIILYNSLSDTRQEFDVSRNFEFPANTSLQAAEARLLDEMVKSLSEDIFNRLFSNW